MPASTLTPNNARVLVVEDDANNRIVITRLLKLAGVKPENIYESEGDPTAFFDSHPDGVDVVLLDLQLPRKDGYTILAELKSDRDLDGTKIIALTANVMRQDIERARSSGFDGFVGKPIDGRRFSDVLGRILAGESVWTVQ